MYSDAWRDDDIDCSIRRMRLTQPTIYRILTALLRRVEAIRATPRQPFGHTDLTHHR